MKDIKYLFFGGKLMLTYNAVVKSMKVYKYFKFNQRLISLLSSEIGKENNHLNFGFWNEIHDSSS